MLDGTPTEVELIFCPVCLDVLSSKFYGKIEYLSRQELKKRTGYWVATRPNRLNIKSRISLFNG